MVLDVVMLKNFGPEHARIIPIPDKGDDIQACLANYLITEDIQWMCPSVRTISQYFDKAEHFCKPACDFFLQILN